MPSTAAGEGSPSKTAPPTKPAVVRPPNLLDQGARLYKRSGGPGKGLERKHAMLLLICNNFSDNVGADNSPVAGKAVDQRGIAENIDHSGDAAAGGCDQGTGFFGEQEPSRS